MRINQPAPAKIGAEQGSHQAALHRLSWLLAALTFPLIWVGGLVTTYDAGMAVPDWPNTFGYNLFAYPLTSWFWGPWDLFIEHGHRLLGALVGCVTLCLVAAAWWQRASRTERWFSLVLLVAVVGQGILGGVRVWRGNAQIAQMHGITGPLFFTMTVVMVWLTRRRTTETTAVGAISPRLRAVACGLVLLVFFQLLLGSFLRHITIATSPAMFQAAVLLHVAGAGLALLYCWYQVIVFHWSGMRLSWGPTHVLALATLITVQFSLGLGTWFLKYGVPNFLAGPDVPLTIVAESMLQTTIVTAHVALGALVLALSNLWAVRLLVPSLVCAGSLTGSQFTLETWPVEAV